MAQPHGVGSRSSIKNILVIGNQIISATVLQALSQKPAFALTVLTYPSQAPLLSRAHNHDTPRFQNIAHRTSDFTAPSLRSAFAGQDLIISTVNGGDYSLQTRIINAVVAAGVTRFIASEFGHDSLNEKVQEQLPPSEERARVIRYLRGMQNEGVVEEAAEPEEDMYIKREAAPGFENPFEWAGVAVGCILDAKIISGELGVDMKWRSATVHGKGTEQFAATSLERVGQVVAKVVEHWEQVKNRYLYAAGCITTANQVIEVLRKDTDQDWEVGYNDTAECVDEATKRMEKGFPDAGMFLMERSILYDEALGAVEPFKMDSANTLLGLEEEKPEAIIGAAIHGFAHQGAAECGCS
ncbi:uncharacterized protein K452DRAFT_328076 [Aplosporella prunicola CBS 121167]|uniref:NmrA-like domain-containing protein n=1 Tax=Aplosporella prunicola CBS 121167 TaxID=1176127 RepID=A0A6A6B7V7_9PEZI|nr:uncharacterized protein K452DRAFT_328076 [Aplosporella prunicola CBS 121167]KAF2139648.1 hypothetical protein K452DRAFT_328076 [Aplosporella prunicola CBS 121167]